MELGTMDLDFTIQDGTDSSSTSNNEGLLESILSGEGAKKKKSKRSRSCSRPGLQKVAICAACWPATAAL